MKNKKGFTLIELMIVVAIIGVLAAVAIPRFVQSTDDAKTKACDANIAQINSQWEIQYVQDGDYEDITDFDDNTTYFPDGWPVCPHGDSYTDVSDNYRIDAHSH